VLLARLRSKLPVGALVVLLVLPFAAAADKDEKNGKKKKDEDRAKYTVDEVMHQKLNDTIEFIGNDQYEEALEILLPLEKKGRRLKPYPRALVYQMLAYVYSSQEDYPTALDYFEKCLAEEALPPGAQLSTRYNVAQLYLATEQFEDAARSLNIWFEKAESPSPGAYYLLAAVYYQLQEPEKSLAAVEKAVELSDEPKEAWLTLQTGLYFELEMYEKAVVPLEQLVSRFSRKGHWTQLSALYAHLELEDKSLAVMQLAYQQDLLDKDRELRTLAKLYLHHDLPYRSAVVIEKGMEDEIIELDEEIYELLANSWIMAKELDRSLEPLAKAAEMSEAGDLYMRLAQVHLQREEWREASEALLHALEKGGLDDEAGVNLLLGISYYNLDRPDRARKHFIEARVDETIREGADQWLAVMENEAIQEQQRLETESAATHRAPEERSSGG
jgi:tetratricopeptide (TPR) repeat protein